MDTAKVDKDCIEQIAHNLYTKEDRITKAVKAVGQKLAIGC